MLTRKPVLQHRVGRDMEVCRPERTERREPPHELNRLQFTAELQLENVPHLHFVGSRQAESLQPLLAEASYWRSQATHSQRYRRRRPAVSVMGIRSAQNRRARSLPVSNISFQAHRIVRQDLVL